MANKLSKVFVGDCDLAGGKFTHKGQFEVGGTDILLSSKTRFVFFPSSWANLVVWISEVPMW